MWPFLWAGGLGESGCGGQGGGDYFKLSKQPHAQKVLASRGVRSAPKYASSAFPATTTPNQTPPFVRFEPPPDLSSFVSLDGFLPWLPRQIESLGDNFANTSDIRPARERRIRSRQRGTGLGHFGIAPPNNPSHRHPRSLTLTDRTCPKAQGPPRMVVTNLLCVWLAGDSGAAPESVPRPARASRGPDMGAAPWPARTDMMGTVHNRCRRGPAPPTHQASQRRKNTSKT